ncbi:MAG TPA: hypothetical protein VE172_01605 [Stackebrandtia sp.]|jgi:hypothetical protein|uniref:hypothetical protein n=1 Tax=Stackebrandtia sp. TaxID=2023065 RepID=UPI002D56FD38|nr:hypothetical protein [Stackebrandtia sp.]HZE37482.1 hypothetical protein [Stackebrandtia sp.]
MDSAAVLLAARLVPWLRAWRAGLTSLDEVVTALTSGWMSGVEQVVLGETEALGTSLPNGLARLSSVPCHEIRLVLAVPGDARGLPVSGPFAAAGLTAGEAVVAGVHGLVPEHREHTSGSGDDFETVTWRLYTLDDPPLPVADVGVGEADLALTEALHDATKRLTDMDVASWNPDLGRALGQARKPQAPDLPPGFDPRARRLYARALLLNRVVAVAESDAMGGAVTAAEAAARLDALRPLAAACRQAIGAACHARLG